MILRTSAPSQNNFAARNLKDFALGATTGGAFLGVFFDGRQRNRQKKEKHKDRHKDRQTDREQERTGG